MTKQFYKCDVNSEFASHFAMARKPSCLNRLHCTWMRTMFKDNHAMDYFSLKIKFTVGVTYRYWLVCIKNWRLLPLSTAFQKAEFLTHGKPVIMFCTWKVRGRFGKSFRPGKEEDFAKKYFFNLSPVFLFISLTSAGRGPSQDSMISRICI